MVTEARDSQPSIVAGLLAVSASTYFLVLLVMAAAPAPFGAGLARCTLDRHTAAEGLALLAVAATFLGGPITLILGVVAVFKRLRWAVLVLLLTVPALPLSMLLLNRIEASAERQSPGHRKRCHDRKLAKPGLAQEQVDGGVAGR